MLKSSDADRVVEVGQNGASRLKNRRQKAVIMMANSGVRRLQDYLLGQSS
jgi:hypothetical protein